MTEHRDADLDAMVELAQDGSRLYSLRGIDDLAEAAHIARDERDLFKRQVEAVDAHLPPWEPPPGYPHSSVGRTQTITNLCVDRERGKAAQTRLTAALDALRRLEWAGAIGYFNDTMVACCPSCRLLKAKGTHTPGCWLAAIISQTEAQP